MSAGKKEDHPGHGGSHEVAEEIPNWCAPSHRHECERRAVYLWNWTELSGDWRILQLERRLLFWLVLSRSWWQALYRVKHGSLAEEL